MKKPFKSIGASTISRLETAVEAARKDGYEPCGERQRQIRLWSGNVYQMLFVQSVILVDTHQDASTPST